MRTNSTFFTVTNPTLPLNFLFILFLMIGSANGFGQVTINRANGNINSCVFPTNYTTLGDIYLEENENNNFAFADRYNFTLIITAPTNFEFLAGTGSVSYRDNQDITAASISVTVTTITITYRSNQGIRTNGDDRLTISGIQFRGITGPSSGDMTRTGGTGTINGAPNGAVFGTLTSTNNPLPAIGGGVAAVCVGAATPAFTNATPGGTWSITNGSGAATITSGGVVTGTAAGTVTVIYSLNGCAANRSLTINPLPAAIAGGSTAVCVGSSTPAFTNATVGGTWSVVPGTGTGTITAGGVLTGTSAGTVTVRYTLASGCYTSSAPITVNPLPATVTTPSPANGAAGVCYAGPGSVSGISWAAAAGANSYDVYFGAGSLPGSAVNVSTNSYNTGVLLPNTTYYWRVVAKNGCGDAVSSATWSFTTSGTPCYCASSGGTFPDGITGVNFNTINNLGTSVNTGYTDYTSISTTVLKGYTYPLSIYINTGGNYTNHQSAYIDWNGDGDFVDAGEFYNLGTATNVTNGSSSASPLNITVPAGAVTGSVRMRIQSRYNSATTGPCQTGFDGEVEDYTINIVPALPCTTPTAQPTNLVLTPSAGTINGNFTAAVPPAYSYLVVMNTTGIAPTPADNVDYVIGSTALGGTNTVVDNDSNTAFTATTLNPLTTYYFFVFSYNNYCTGGTKYLLANPLTGNATTPDTNYCIPSTSNSTEYIAGVSSVGTLNDVSNSPTGYSPNGYGNYSSVVIATQIPGNGINFNLILPTAPAEAQFIKVWVDWNKDGNFSDTSELVYTSGNTATGSTSFGFVVPAGQITGDLGEHFLETVLITPAIVIIEVKPKIIPSELCQIVLPKSSQLRMVRLVAQ
ncbi:beta strand repeat-containing protein [Kaistella sp.]|uniref:beta strand repeat-containing protein n=1 Tax=Kaistella sp. TaxID=2782235 RepID=UPI002F92E5C7